MSTPAEITRFAWEPLTPRGVAAFGHASLRRLLLVQFLFALWLAVAACYFVSHAWFPVVDAAIRQLPEQGEMRAEKLNWRGRSPEFLGDNRFLALIVDLPHSGQIRSPAHIQIEFGETNVLAFSLFGRAEVAYPKGWIVGFNRAEMGPWWGAWKPPILAITIGVVILGSMFLWAVMATIYFLPVWLIGFFANRDLDLRGSWKLAGATSMPGALLLGLAVLLYTWGALDLIRLCVAAGLSVVIGWIYLVASPLLAPRLAKEKSLKENPFAQTEKS
jgi:hypothetical protein